MSSQLPDDPKRDAFLAAADQMGEHESMFDAFCVEPWPGWFLKVVLRMGQVFAPELRPTDLREHPERFFAIVAGVNLSLIKAAEELDLTQLPDEPICNLVRKELELIKTDETARFKETQNRAVDLPGYEAMGFSVALGETVKKETAFKSIERLGEVTTAGICLFLIFSRQQIESGTFRNVTELWNCFLQLRIISEGNGSDFYEKNPEVRKSLEAQFRKICSQCDVKLAKRGRPSKK